MLVRDCDDQMVFPVVSSKGGKTDAEADRNSEKLPDATTVTPTNTEKKRARVEEAIKANPSASNLQIAKATGVDDKTVGKLRKRQAKPEVEAVVVAPVVEAPVVEVEEFESDDDIPGVFEPRVEEETEEEAVDFRVTLVTRAQQAIREALRGCSVEELGRGIKALDSTIQEFV